jgi:hypothetical protein
LSLDEKKTVSDAKNLLATIHQSFGETRFKVLQDLYDLCGISKTNFFVGMNIFLIIFLKTITGVG